MPSSLAEIMDEAAALISDISVINRRLKFGEKMTDEQLARLRHRAAEIVVMLQALKAED